MSKMSISKGAGPRPKPWPQDYQFDEELLEKGDKRNVSDNYRYKTVEAIKKDMQERSFGLEVAIENYQHDFNIGSIVRSANAFNARKVHIIGKKQWNKRGAMMTDKYLEIVYHVDSQAFIDSMKDKQIIAVDNKPGATELQKTELPTKAVYVFGSESDGVSEAIIKASSAMVAIEQFGSTRSVNVGVASGILMYEWTRRNVIDKKSNAG